MKDSDSPRFTVKILEPGLVAHTFSLSSGKAEAGGSLSAFEVNLVYRVTSWITQRKKKEKCFGLVSWSTLAITVLRR